MKSQTILSNFIWRFLERSGAQIVQLVVSIVLARLLAPTDYGTVALMNVFISILGIFVNCGLSSALIQKKNADDTDFSTVFYAQMLFCIIMYVVLFISAPYIAIFYEIPEMTWMIRTLGLTLIIAGVKNVQTAYVSRTMQFKRFFFATLGGTIGAAFVGIGMAAAGFGAWALIGQSLFNNTVDTIILWMTVKWKPKKLFSFNRLKGLFSYSWKLLFSSLLDTVYNNLRSLIIGKGYSAQDLAYYNRGQSWPQLIIENVNSSIDSVLFPSMSAAQNDRERVKMMTRRAIKTSTYIIAPLMMGLAFCGTPLVRLVLTEKWLFCVPFQVIFCITYMFYPIHTANLNAIKAMGRSDLFLKLEIIKKIVGLTALAITVPISVMAMGYSLLVTSVLSQIINSWPNKRLLNYGYLEQLKDILPGIALAVGMGICVYPIQYLGLPDVVTLLLQVVAGMIIYIGGSALFKLESFVYLKDMMKSFKRR
ncbi:MULTISPECIES: lipopolysaccharide biosynthesis protein [Bacillota]|uniref:lipopolysaccharide biosynthesis protein n=1 Tax=Holdemanella sp. TaxID=1971762 RepID=UPI00243305F7|nr:MULTISPECIES: lipopolysaccharide biosynthesis protein [Bacillota]